MNCSRRPRLRPCRSASAWSGRSIYTFGSEKQKQQFLPRIANLDDWWCQGFSEPGAGSDLAGLKTTAKRDGDHYVINGQKTWTTLGQYADWIFVLARTDSGVKKQEGISFILCDMKTPGITVRPIVTIDGGAEVNEVFLDDVRVPVENLVGQENKGWDYAKFLLGNERVGIARVGASKERIRRIKELAKAEMDGQAPLIENMRFRERVASVEIELKALEITQLRVVAAERKREKGKPDPASLDPQDQRIGKSSRRSRNWRWKSRAPTRCPIAVTARMITAGTSRRSVRTGHRQSRRPTSIRERFRSTADRTRSRRTSSQRPSSASDALICPFLQKPEPRSTLGLDAHLRGDPVQT